MYCNVLDDIPSLPAHSLLTVMIFMVTLDIISTQIQVTALHFDTHTSIEIENKSTPEAWAGRTLNYMTYSYTTVSTFVCLF